MCNTHMNRRSSHKDDLQTLEHFPRAPKSEFFDALPLTGEAVFDYAIRVVFHHEGIYSNDPDDPGGPTMWGWSLRAARKFGALDGVDFDIDNDGDIDVDDIKALTPEDAIEKYDQTHWSNRSLNRLLPHIAVKTLDLSVVMGEPQAVKLLQRSVRACGAARLVDDGLLGPATISAVNKCDEFALLCAYRAHAAGFFKLLTVTNTKSKKYLNGWLNRAYF